MDDILFESRRPKVTTKSEHFLQKIIHFQRTSFLFNQDGTMGKFYMIFWTQKDLPDVTFNSPNDVITNDFPLFRPPEMENSGYKEIEDYVDYDAYNMIGARAKKLPNGDKEWFKNDLCMWGPGPGHQVPGTYLDPPVEP